jgi:hypothetical protein
MMILHNDSDEPRPAVASGALTLLHTSTVARAPLRMLTLYPMLGDSSRSIADAQKHLLLPNLTWFD